MRLTSGFLETVEVERQCEDIFKGLKENHYELGILHTRIFLKEWEMEIFSDI